VRSFGIRFPMTVGPSGCSMAWSVSVRPAST
jgi:hypothetical protein